jgi:Hint domain
VGFARVCVTKPRRGFAARCRAEGQEQVTLTISAIDSQFATATGSNYNVRNDRSGFDTPLESNTDLTITTTAGDSTNYLFSLGDLYDLTWQGASGTMTMTDAVVVRSDHYFDKAAQGIVVFDGIDQNGNATQIIWTENLDVRQWYYDNFNGRNPPLFWNGDQDATTYGHICFSADTLIDTPAGPVPVGEIEVGDRVLTRDHGPQPVLWVGRRRARGIGKATPVRFLPGTLANRDTLRLSPQHRVLLSGAAVRRLTGGDEVLVPAKGLIGYPGIAAAPTPDVTYVNFLCDSHEIVTAGTGASCESLYLGPQARRCIAEAARDPFADYPGLGDVGIADLSAARVTARRVLSVGETRALLAALGDAPLVDTPVAAPAPAPARGPRPKVLAARRSAVTGRATAVPWRRAERVEFAVM